MKARNLQILMAFASLFLMACLCNPTGIDIPFVSMPQFELDTNHETVVRDGPGLFNAVVLEPIPATVNVLHYADETPLLSPTIYLHFTLTPADFEQILASANWEQQEYLLQSDAVPHVEAWWAANDLEGLEKYQLYDPTGPCKCIKTIWINAAHTEAYVSVAFL